jgi:phosphoglycerol transferase MdoB-like AlkP superfamily enzyme
VSVYFYLSSLFDNADIVTYRYFANKLLSTFRLKFFSAYVHIDVVKSSELSSLQEDVKFKFIRLIDIAAEKLDMKIMCMKTVIRA